MFSFDCLASLRLKLSQNDVSVGTWLQLGSSSAAEILSRSGFDWVVIDEEHGVSLADKESLISSISNSTCLPFVRIAEFSAASAIRYLEAGCAGVIVPNLTSVNQWQEFVQSVSYPPAGSRGVGFCRANSFGAAFEEYFEIASNPFLVPMIESVEGISALTQLGRDDQLDAILVGPYDLSVSLGCVGEFDNPRFKKAIDHILSVCSESSIPAGIHVVNPYPHELQERIAQGFKFLAYGMDSTMLRLLVNPLKNQ